jgi:CRISPR-associated endonuclease/helicase Cas3
MRYDDMFERATGRAPHPYQRRMALMESLPVALSAPTGAGKTAGAALAWLYKRRFAEEPIRRVTPRRLVLCLPMRTLVTQTADVVADWLGKLGLLERGRGLDRGDGVGVHVIMGGEVDDDWHLHPERDAVIVGTQDMLLSRALNRGYALSRFFWPWHYGLLSNDCLWVFDEVQLMGVGLATGLQLAAFRQRIGAFGPTATLFMSATMEPGWLETVDHPAPSSIFTLDAEDLGASELRKRRHASKKLLRAKTALSRADKSASARLADEILAHHVQGTRTIAVLNTVDRAIEVFAVLDKKAGKQGSRPVLLHSRFRPLDRGAALARAIAKDFDGIVVSTQVIEAGVDLSSRTLFTEIAPWASLVQRAGRCNRGGEYEEAHVLWVDHDPLEKGAALPYEAADLADARSRLALLDSFNPEAIARANVAMPLKEPAHVLRRRDAVDLFDTTADLGGADLDVSRFIREGDERDVQVFWRDVGDEVAKDQARPAREELCSVPFLALRRWLLAPRRAFRWDAIDGAWRATREHEIVPGTVLLLRARDGGYDPTRGWTGGSEPTLPLPLGGRADKPEPEEAMDADPFSELDRWVSLTNHATDTKRAAEEIVRDLPLPPELRAIVIRAAHAHDLGKAHEVFQETMRTGYSGLEPGPWAKSGRRTFHSRRGFRHELASALTWLARGEGEERDLIAYLLAAHHGKVRLSIRAMPDEKPPPGPERLYARGVWDGDGLPEVDLGEGLVVAATTLSLIPMRAGRHDGAPSWMERAIALRERFGPFRLAYLEALVRAADVRASMREDPTKWRRKSEPGAD